jgi:hypothetical protein
MDNRTKGAIVVGIGAGAAIGIVLATRKASAAPEAPPGTVGVTLKNPPADATKWQMMLIDWNITDGMNWGGNDLDNIAEQAVFQVPESWASPYRVWITIYRMGAGGALVQLYNVQSYRPYLWDWDAVDWSDEPDPDYRGVFIPRLGGYYYNVTRERFE